MSGNINRLMTCSLFSGFTGYWVAGETATAEKMLLSIGVRNLAVLISAL
jgi:hypothetical protein